MKKKQQIVRQGNDSAGTATLMLGRHTVGQLVRPVTQHSWSVRKAHSGL